MSNNTVQIVDKASSLGATRTAKVDANGNLQVTAAVQGQGTQITASSTNAATALTATLTAVTGKTTYITGFLITGAGATSASVINVTITGTITGTLNYNVVVPAGVTTSIQPTGQTFAIPIAASAVSTSIVVNVPSFGSGNTNAAVAAYGYSL